MTLTSAPHPHPGASHPSVHQGKQKQRLCLPLVRPVYGHLLHHSLDSGLQDDNRPFPANPSPLCLSPRSPPKLPVKYAVENKISKKLLETWPMTSPPRPKRKVSPSPSPKPPSPEALAALGAHAKRCAACAERYQLTHLLASETETKKKVSKTSVRCSSRRSQSTTPPPLKLSLQSSTTSPSARTPTPPNSAPATQVNRSATRLSPLSPGKGQKKQTKSPTKKSRRTRSPVKSVSQSVTSQSQPDEMSPQDPLVVSPMTPIESSPFNESPEQTPDQGERPSSQISEASPRQALVSTSPTASAPQTAQGEKMTSGASVMSESSPSTLPFTPPALTSPTESLSVSIPSPVRSAGVSSPRPEACEDAVAQSPVKATSPKSSVSPPPEQVKPSTDVELSSEGAEKEVEAAESSSGTTQQPSPPKILSLQHLGPEMGNELTVRITARSKSASPTRRASPRASPQTGLKETVVATAVAATVITTLAKDLELSQTGCDDEQEKVPSKESSVILASPQYILQKTNVPRTGEVPPVAVASLISVNLQRRRHHHR
ncbi:hypothetical protein BaRGS_00014546 [Batillaria attramentaria]|uniref:Flocculation protein FLO11-like n=1 Tax=Batillaria attramentaria TaxID=370345 RepID=A0ABD0L3Z9_9CAEN